jgi:hypothetical protein
MQIHFDHSGFDTLGKAFFAAGKSYRQHVIDTMDQAGPELVIALMNETPVGATGKLRQSTGYEVIDMGDIIMLEVSQPAKSRYFGFASRLVYRPMVAFGRKPGRMPPYQALMDWVRIVLMVPQNKAKHVAFNIARSISRKGTLQHYNKETPHTQRAINRNEHIFLQVAEQIKARITVTLYDFRSP